MTLKINIYTYSKFNYLISSNWKPTKLENSTKKSIAGYFFKFVVFRLY